MWLANGTRSINLDAAMLTFNPPVFCFPRSGTLPVTLTVLRQARLPGGKPILTQMRESRTPIIAGAGAVPARREPETPQDDGWTNAQSGRKGKIELPFCSLAQTWQNRSCDGLTCASLNSTTPRHMMPFLVSTSSSHGTGRQSPSWQQSCGYQECGRLLSRRRSIKLVAIALFDDLVGLFDGHVGGLGLLDDHPAERREIAFVDPVVIVPEF
jgi:hypothetical protein